MTYAMSRAEREQFLAQPHVGVVSVVEDGAPLTTRKAVRVLADEGLVEVVPGRGVYVAER